MRMNQGCDFERLSWGGVGCCVAGRCRCLWWGGKDAVGDCRQKRTSLIRSMIAGAGAEVRGVEL